MDKYIYLDALMLVTDLVHMNLSLFFTNYGYSFFYEA